MDFTSSHETQVETQILTVNAAQGARRTSRLPARKRHSLPSNNRNIVDNEAQVQLGELSSPGESDDGSNFRKSLQIDMKGLVGDAVGNMSISPASRDVVLAARRGLFIIDLEAPLEVPRFLPQGGTWDVADVQWNPHASRAEYIVSTSSEKLLIWNLMMSGKTSIEHILHSHYRAITDINWHTTERDTVVSTGIDSWVWAWDIREPRKPIFGLCAFNSPGTQVKWNRQDGNILASSHADKVLIWDRRKGSLPITTIQGHTSRIYGIDWSHSVRDEIVTCSLDKTIKLWNINDVDNSSDDCARTLSNTDEHLRIISRARVRPEPKATIRTTYPVWRARNLPFGRGVLSLAQRGETALEMYAAGGERQIKVPVEKFEGHTDVVKEFVWRKGGFDGKEFQLITWSKDRTLRFWPVDSDMMQKVGYTPVNRGRSRSLGESALQDQSTTSFRNLPQRLGGLPRLSAPIGNRSILAEVRSGLPLRRRNNSLNLQQRYTLSATQDNNLAANLPYRAHLQSLDDDIHLSSSTGSNDTLHSSSVKKIAVIGAGGGTMSRGAAGSKLRARVDALSWLSSVKVGEKRRGSSSGNGSRANSGEASRLSSRSAGGSKNDVSVAVLAGSKRRRSESRSRVPGEDKEVGQSLQDEITSVLAKLPASKIRLEKHDLTKKRTCTLGLQVPWGANSSVFLRITFTFPKEYPQSSHPDGTPTINLEHTPLITMKDRAFILRRLRTLRESRRPCLEACLRFLLFRSEDEKADTTLHLDSESSSDDDDDPSSRKPREVTVSWRNNKNLAEPRTSQGSFGPNGELVCFFRAPPRIVRNIMTGLSRSPAKSSDRATPSVEDTAPRLFQSPSLVADAVRRLGLAARDRYNRAGEIKREGGDHITRIMTNLLTYPRHRGRRESESVLSEDVPNAYALALVTPRRSTVLIANTNVISGGDRAVATDYIFASHDILDVCDVNAAFARGHGRYDHERIFRTLGAVLGTRASNIPTGRRPGQLAKQLLDRLLSELRAEKDAQMLAMVATIILQAFYSSPAKKASLVPSPLVRSRLPSAQGTPSPNALDYFAPRYSRSSNHASPMSPTGSARLPLSPGSLQPPAEISSSASSRGSWSSLFNTGSMRQLMNGMQDSLKDGLTTPSELPPTHSGPLIAVPRYGRVLRGPDSPVPTQREKWKESVNMTPSKVSRSWNETLPKNMPVSPPARHQRLTFSQVASSRVKISNEKKRIVFIEPTSESQESEQMFTAQDIDLLLHHVQFYAEMLFSWQLYHKRIELLKSVNEHNIGFDSASHGLGLVRTCSRCGTPQPAKLGPCESCGNLCGMPTCTICRLSVRGLSINCVRCLHVVHVSCWKSLRIAVCPSGCGCACEVTGPYASPSIVRSPQSITHSII